MYATFLADAEAFRDEIIRLRRHFHAHPERSYEETASTALVAETLRSFGITDVRTGFGVVKTGVTADIAGRADGPCIALRADMDALPMQEQADVPWKSTVPGVMHACGHDAHMAVLLGAARLLQTHADKLPGRVRLIFQPGEETRHPDPAHSQSGSMFAIQAGVLEGVDAVCGLHVWGTFPAGCLLVREGATMMASARFGLRVIGKGGHGGLPHDTVDPIPVACELVCACQRIISREIDPLEPALLTFGSIHGGTADNIIPESVELQGSIRALSTAQLEYIRTRLKDMAEGICKTHRCTVELHLPSCGAPVVNDAAMVRLLREAATEIIGAERVRETRPVSASEDFRHYAARVPGVYAFWGMADPDKGIGHSQHDPAFQTNDDQLHEAAAVLAATAWRFLQQADSQRKAGYAHRDG